MDAMTLCTHIVAVSAPGRGTQPAFVQGGADPNAEDGGGQKPIHAAAAEQHRDVVEALIPVTQPDADSASSWTVDGIIQEAQQSIAVEQPHIMQHQVGPLPSPQGPLSSPPLLGWTLPRQLDCMAVWMSAAASEASY